MKIIVLLCLCFINISIKAQDSSKSLEAKTIFTKVEIESHYPGGGSAWNNYLKKTLRYPSEALINRIEGTVVVYFVIDSAGNVSNIKAISGPEKGGLREEAVRLIKMSGRWEPVNQGGKNVKSFRREPIIFKLDQL